MPKSSNLNAKKIYLTNKPANLAGKSYIFSWTGTLFLACCVVRASIDLVPELLATVTLKLHSVSTHIRAMIRFSAIPAAEFRGWVLDHGGVRGCIAWHTEGVEGWVRSELRHWGRRWKPWPGPQRNGGGVGIAKPNGRVPGCGKFCIICGGGGGPALRDGWGGICSMGCISPRTCCGSEGPTGLWTQSYIQMNTKHHHQHHEHKVIFKWL